MGDGGGGGGGNSGGYDAAPGDYAQRQREKKQEEQRLERASNVTGKSSYVRGGKKDGKKGNIVRSSDGTGVVTSAGQSRRDASREEDFMNTNSGSKTAKQTIREGAIFELEKRMKSTLPGMMGVISKANLQKQIDVLKAGGDPTKARTGSGYVTVGVTGKDGQTYGRASAGGTMAKTFSDEGGEGGDNSATSPVAGGGSAPAPSKPVSGAATRRLLQTSAEKGAKRRMLIGRPSV